ncbi:hypothetical protein DSM25559_1386 [Agrobacterium rosae]|uniref:Uncharacterized protein n=1 Tax=Agrobacterium rosae TaxID=1972867 RepID=A0A1R3TFT6_9HYPH|nr:hypothetical protein DSM25559_1386 [Agrobacterium rosae]
MGDPKFRYVEYDNFCSNGLNPKNYKFIAQVYFVEKWLRRCIVLQSHNNRATDWRIPSQVSNNARIKKQAPKGLSSFE